MAREKAVGGGRTIVALDRETWQALHPLARGSMKSFQELADEAFADLLNKRGRPVTLGEQRRASANSRAPARKRAGNRQRSPDEG